MHLLSTRPGGFVEDDSIVTCLDQTPADVVVLSSADTTLALLAAAQGALLQADAAFPSLRLANVLHLRQNASFDRYADEVLRHARVVIVDHLGSESAWPYGIGQLGALARLHGQALALFSGDLTEDPDLLARGTLPVATARRLWQYLRAGGAGNARAFLQAVAFHGLGHGSEPPPPRPMPQVALHAPPAWIAGAQAAQMPSHAATNHAVPESDDRAALQTHWHAGAPVVALVFYRSHLLAGNTAAFDDLALALHAQGLNPLPLALDSLKDPLCLAALRQLCDEHAVQLVLNTTAFAALGHGEASAAFEPLAGDAPVLQVIVSGGNRDDWLQDSQGLRPRDIAMQVVLPEVDGRVITRAISFKAGTRRCPHTQVDLVHYQSEPDRIAFVAKLAARWCRLRRLPASDKRLALVLANYPGSEARIGSGVGLDTPASVIALLRLLRDEGHDLGDAVQLPADGDALMRALTAGIANDPAQWPLRPAFQSYALADYRTRLAQLPPGMLEAITARWGAPEADPLLRQGRFMIAGLRLGKVFIGIQPARTLDAALGGAADYASYHDADLVPPHSYLAFYFWLRDVFGVDAIAHVGKHGNLEWLPGKSLALSAACWPDAILGPLPHLYPFIVNDPGEGAQAKRRAQAVIIDHLMPPLTRAENHGPMQELERLVDEYYEALLVDLRRAALLRQQILALARQQRLAEELGLPEAAATSPANAPDASAAEEALLTRIDAYLCELKETQIRDGLHVFGQSPQGRQRRDTLLALARYASGDSDGGDIDGANAHGSAQQSEGLLAALAADLLGESFDPFHDDPAQPWHGPRPAALQAVSSEAWRHHGHTRERLELLAAGLLEAALPDGGESARLPSPPAEQPDATTPPPGPRTRAALARIARVLAPRLDACGPRELAAFSAALQGRFVPPGPSGSPSRGRPDVLPTGRNFYTVDTRAIPTRTAWALGEKAAQRLIERHLQEHGDYPRAIGLSVWGTATMRTGGDDIAQALALIGVRPKWAPGSQRVVDFEIIPRVGLHRPRVDVTLRISGLFRDAFPATVQLFDAAVQAVAAQDGEDEADNPIRARILQDSAALQASGMGAQQARQQAGWRIFGAAPGHYGSGLDTLLQHNQWDSDADLAHAWLARGQHAYGQHDHGSDASQMLPRRLAQLDVVLQNQDSREHDLLDSGDYWQFQGGMAAAVRHLSGRQPALYHGDHGNPAQPRVRALREEIARIVRARVTNPKWIEGAMRHGYKGAFEMAATVDYLFGFDATCRVVGDHQYALVADAYAFNDATRAFLQAHNPQALADILARLREAIARGLWQQPGDYAARLHELALAHDERMEGSGR
ncbi:cobaltochelatase subunit CobN [Allofranklinella schreckenbergeri]|uniref:Cobaltochelatase subunit CobN n=1 Tax=Allofranklinella schreckenbergeri TaxID=1076744 RepID=A0A3M6R2T1_9BURK|nr:cobaltochelatase subunit CobN [Allofranklinella schreckenbergeri]RMX09526.1 cobaltochelatase subunit CobN [Allofranklinella schreckenbergeri]